MFYFLRTVFIYFVLFTGLSLAIHKGVNHYFLGDKADNSMALSFNIPAFQANVRDTESGLMLAGISAQNRRDWGEAGRIFATLNEKFDKNPHIALRAMTLALGNGEYVETEKIAESINSIDSKNINEQPFDLFRLFLTLKLIKSSEFDVALDSLKHIEKSALAKFIVPIIESWVNAVKNPALLNSKTANMGHTHIFYKSLAAEYAGNKKIAMKLMAKISGGAMSPQMIMDIASFYVRMDSSDKAIDLLRREIIHFNKNKILRDALTNLQTDNGKFKPEARSTYHLKGIKSALSVAFHDFARSMMLANATDSALLFARMAVYLDDKSPSVYAMIGDILALQGQDDESIALYAKVEKGDIVHQYSLRRQIEKLIDLNKLPKAKNIVSSAIDIAEESSLDVDANLYYLLGNIYKADKKYSKALDAYDHAEILGKHQNGGELKRNLWSLYYSRAIVLDLMDRWEDAKKDLFIAKEKMPNNPIILNYIGYAYADRGVELDTAKKMLLRAVHAVPNDGFIVDSMGWLLYQMGDYDGAVKYLERAAILRPYHMVINDHLGDVYWKKGRLLEAHYMWQRAVDYYDASDEEQVKMIADTKLKLVNGL